MHFVFTKFTFLRHLEWTITMFGLIEHVCSKILPAEVSGRKQHGSPVCGSRLGHGVM